MLCYLVVCCSGCQVIVEFCWSICELVHAMQLKLSSLSIPTIDEVICLFGMGPCNFIKMNL